MDKELQKLIEQRVDIRYNIPEGHIFIVNAWIDSIDKEKILIKCIKRLKEFNIPVLLITSSNRPDSSNSYIREEISQMVDYFIVDDNEILTSDRFGEFKLDSLRWTKTSHYLIENQIEFHHDFAVLKNLKNAIIFSNNLGKKYIHYIEYDNIIDTFQFSQTFLEQLNYHDVVLFKNLAHWIGHIYYLFSMNMDLAMKFIQEITTIENHFRCEDWRMEDYIINRIKKYTNNIGFADYLDNEKSLNLNAVWNRAGINRNGIYTQIYLVSNGENLYLHLISDSKQIKNILLEIRYLNYNKFFWLKPDSYELLDLGKYLIDEKIVVNYLGIKIFEEKLNMDVNKFSNKNKITFM